MTQTFKYFGLSGLTLPVDHIDLGHGVVIERSFAHLTSPCLVAFAPAPPGKHHPPPWRPATGGFAFDITFELRIPERVAGFVGEDAVRTFLALFRVTVAPIVFAPAMSTMPLNLASQDAGPPCIALFEVEERITYRPLLTSDDLPAVDLDWFKSAWFDLMKLLHKEPKLLTALHAWDVSFVRGRSSTALLIVWGAIEQLFAPARSELRYRLASNLAAFLEPRGERRLATFKQVMRLYEHRSAMAHSASAKADSTILLESWLLLRNALMKILTDGTVPNQERFERLLFEVEAVSEEDLESWGVVFPA